MVAVLDRQMAELLRQVEAVIDVFRRHEILRRFDATVKVLNLNTASTTHVKVLNMNTTSCEGII